MKTNTMKTLAITMFIFASSVPFVEEPQYLQAPKPATIHLKRK